MRDVSQGVLERVGFGAFDNVFDLGDHWLMAVRSMSRLRAASGFDLALGNLRAYGNSGAGRGYRWAAMVGQAEGPCCDAGLLGTNEKT